MAQATLYEAILAAGGSRVAEVPLACETLVHLTHTLEDLVLERKLTALICAGLGPARSWPPRAARLIELSRTAAAVVVLGDGVERLNGADGLATVPVAPGAPLLDERFLLVLSHSFSAVLCARTRNNGVSFSAVWSFEPDLVGAGLDWLTGFVQATGSDAALHAILSVRRVLTPLTIDVRALSHFTTEMIRFEEQLHQELARVERERTRVYEREALLSTIARAFIDLPADQIDVAVDAALLAVGQFAGADRCFLIERGATPDLLEVSYQWAGPGQGDLRFSQRAGEQGLLVHDPGLFDAILVDDLEAVEGDDPLRRELLAQGVRSLAAIPMVYRETLQGFVSLAAHAPRQWTDEDRYLLETLMEIVVAALEHRRVERALGETESLLQRVIYSTNHMVYVYAVMRDGAINQMYSSSNIEHLLGYPSALKMADWEFWTSLIVPADRLAARGQLEKLLRGEDSETEYRMVHADGRVLWMRDSARCEPGTGDTRCICYGVISDITDRHTAEQALREHERLQIALEAERKVGEMRNRFMLVVSHEFRTPLSIILTSSEMLDRYYDRMDHERRKERLGIIRAQVQHLRAMLDEISIVIRAELGRLEFRPMPADVAEFSRQIAAEMASSVGALHRIQVAAEPTTLRAMVDTTLLRHVLTNLLSNAIKFSADQTPILLRVWLDETGTEPEIGFEVLDEGIGIQPDDLTHLFEPFFRGHNVGAISGTGLGLKVVRDCLARHGGRVTAEPRPERGSRFLARVPYEPAPDESGFALPDLAAEAPESGFTKAG